MIRSDVTTPVRTPTRRQWVLRFTRTERVAHWVQAISFLTLMATGFLISITVLEEAVGHRALWREVHLWSALLFVFGPTLVALAGNRRAVGETIREVDEWTGEDASWLAHPALDPTPFTPPADRLNAGQKLNAIFTLYSTFAFGITGLILWQNRRFPFSVVQQASTIHNLLAYVALLVFLGHVYLATVHPATRHALRGILTGMVQADWAAHHHARWTAGPAQEPPLTPAVALRAATLFLLGSLITLLVVRFGLEWLGANPTDPLTSGIYRLSMLPGTLAQTRTGVHAFDLAALFWTGLIGTVWLAVARGWGK